LGLVWNVKTAALDGYEDRSVEWTA
jgi:hypothetical protein